MRIRGDIERFPGGDYVQATETCAALQRLGVECRLVPGIGRVEGRFDIRHLFNTTRLDETWQQFRQGRAAGSKIVLSPIWHSISDMQRFYGPRLHDIPIDWYLASKEAFYALRSGLWPSLPAILSFRRRRRFLLSQCDAVLPNSDAEAQIMTRESGVQPRVLRVAPLGCRAVSRNIRSAVRSGFLCAGRIEPRKNQLNVIRAFKQLGHGFGVLSLYGAANVSHGDYVRAVTSECVPGWVEYHGPVLQPQLMEAAEGARVGIAMSFFESFGLVVLEGLVSGLRMCTSDTELNRELFRDRVTFGDPMNIASISDAIQRACNQPVQDHTKFVRDFTWDASARVTLKCYEEILATVSR